MYESDRAASPMLVGLLRPALYLPEGLQAGETVARGQLLGYVGCTGNACGNHLHFEVDVNGKATDPLPYLGAG